MLRLWARTMVGDKITKSYIYESIDNFDEETFKLHIANLCHEMDIPTPAIIKNHIKNFDEFNNTVFLKRDFVESVDFEKLIIENAALTK